MGKVIKEKKKSSSGRGGELLCPYFLLSLSLFLLLLVVPTLSPLQGGRRPAWGTSLCRHPWPCLRCDPFSVHSSQSGRGGGLLPTFFWLCQLTDLTEKKKRRAGEKSACSPCSSWFTCLCVLLPRQKWTHTLHCSPLTFTGGCWKADC